MSEVRVIRLVTGEDLITEIVAPFDTLSESPTTTKLKNPQVMIMRDAGQGKLAFAFMPFFPFTKGKNAEVNVKTSAILINEEPNPELLNNYNANFGSGIVIAAAGSVPPPDAQGNLQGARII